MYSFLPIILHLFLPIILHCSCQLSCTLNCQKSCSFIYRLQFGNEPNKDLLIDFINALLKGRKVITDLCYNQNEYVGDTDVNGAIILDLTCTASGGERIIIEVQRSTQQYFKRRIVYYGSKLIADQAPKGNRKKWDYKISEVIVIVLIDGFLLPGSEPGMDCLHDICLCNRVTGKVFYENLSFLYIELLNFTKQEFDLETDLEKWLFVLKNMRKMDKLSVFLRKPIFIKLFEIAKYSNLKKEEKDMYDVSLKRKWDTYATLNYAREEGIKEGLEKGIEQGIKQERYELVKNLFLDFDFTDEQAAKAAKVDLAFVQQVRKDLKL